MGILIETIFETEWGIITIGALLLIAIVIEFFYKK